MDPLDAAMKKCGADAFVHYATGDDADMRYLTRFVMHDSFVFFKRRRQPGTIIVPQMEAERASRESIAAVMTRTQAGLPDITKKEKDPWKAAAQMITGQTGKILLVSPTLPAALLRALEESGRVIVDTGTVEQVRAKKTPEEIRLMQAVQKKTERAMALGISLISHATVRQGVLFHEGAPLTAELVRIAIHKQLMDDGCRAGRPSYPAARIPRFPTSSAAAPQAPYTHRDRHVPRDEVSGYYADMTRTISKGKPDGKSPICTRQLRRPSRSGSHTSKPGDGCGCPQRGRGLFQKRGYESDTRGSSTTSATASGFRSDSPHVGPAGSVLEEGFVVTVEPGLYYPVSAASGSKTSVWLRPNILQILRNLRRH